MPLPLPPSGLTDDVDGDRMASGTGLAIAFLGSLGIWAAVIGLIFWR